jgi:RNA 3'-terminal phosphate cyclase
VSFRPGPVEPGDYAFAVGTAGSASLVLQTVLAALLTCAGGSRVRAVAGGVADRVRRYLALGAGGRFRTLPLSRHTLTSADVIRAFLGARIDVEPENGRTAIVTVTPA